MRWWACVEWVVSTETPPYKVGDLKGLQPQYKKRQQMEIYPLGQKDHKETYLS